MIFQRLHCMFWGNVFVCRRHNLCCRNDRRTIQAVNAEEMEISFFQDQKRIVFSAAYVIEE